MRFGTLLLCLLCLLSATAAYSRSDVVELTEANFDELTKNGTWLVKVYAPWCSHCQQLEPTWHALAVELKQSKIQVGRINGDKQRSLLRRFGVHGYPSIYLLKGWSTWEYKSARTHGQIKEFALGGYKSLESIPFWRSPTSPVGRLNGVMHRLPAYAKDVYQLLKKKGYSDLSIVGGALLIPVVVGALCIFVMDMVVTRHQQHAHYE